MVKTGIFQIAPKFPTGLSRLVHPRMARSFRSLLPGALESGLSCHRVQPARPSVRAWQAGSGLCKRVSRLSSDEHDGLKSVQRDPADACKVQGLAAPWSILEQKFSHPCSFLPPRGGWVPLLHFTVLLSHSQGVHRRTRRQEGGTALASPRDRRD